MIPNILFSHVYCINNDIIYLLVFHPVALRAHIEIYYTNCMSIENKS